MEKIALVTGATDGIGIPTAVELAKRGFRVIVHGRKAERIAAAKAAIEKAVPGAKIETARADLASLAEVRAMGQDVASRFPAIHALVLNAGVFSTKPEKSADGYELTFAVNHLAHFVLTEKLLPSVRAAARNGHGRVVVVSSMAHQSGRLDWPAIEAGGRSTGYEAYAESKLLNVIFASELARRETAAKTGVTANSLHPGVLATKLLRTGWGGGGAPVADGAATSVFLATDPSVAKVTGEYFADSRVARVHRAGKDPKAGERLWAASETLAR